MMPIDPSLGTDPADFRSIFLYQGSWGLFVKGNRLKVCSTPSFHLFISSLLPSAQLTKTTQTTQHTHSHTDTFFVSPHILVLIYICTRNDAPSTGDMGRRCVCGPTFHTTERNSPFTQHTTHHLFQISYLCAVNDARSPQVIWDDAVRGPNFYQEADVPSTTELVWTHWCLLRTESQLHVVFNGKSAFTISGFRPTAKVHLLWFPF